MTIASKLFFHHRSRSDRSSSHSDAAEAEFRQSHRRIGGRASSGDHRRVGSAPALKSSGSLHRLQSSSQVLVVNDEGYGGKYNLDERLPETVNQARERLLLRFRSINLIENRQSNNVSQNLLTIPPSNSHSNLAQFTKRPLNFSGPKRNFTEHLNECSICLEKLLEGEGEGEEEMLTQLKCKHVFHSVCLEKWVAIHNDCPYCRACVGVA